MSDSDVNMRRSQAILRLPVDNVLAQLVMHDGERCDVLLFIASGEDVTRLLTAGDPFIPMIRNAKFCLVGRQAIAALGIPEAPTPPDDAALPLEHQRARIKLLSGATLEGELRWIAPATGRRTADYLNEDAELIELHAPPTVYHVRKHAIASVEELG